MTLTRGDDYPLHQTADPIAVSQGERNFYDRYFFNGYGASGDRFFALAFGIYPQLNIADAAFSIVRDGCQTSLHASRWLEMERLDLTVGPISLAIDEPLQRLRFSIEAPEHGVRAEIRFEARHFPVEEPRFTRRNGARLFLDYTRMTQNGRYSGWIERDGVRESVDGFTGTRDRSWGIRPIGARDSQEAVPPMVPQFFWLWSPCSFEDGSLFFHTNDDAAGRPWNRRAVWVPDGADEAGFRPFEAARCEIAWRSGTRRADAAQIVLLNAEGESELAFHPVYSVQMLGLGYGHPIWGHGARHGKSAVAREDLMLAELDPGLLPHQHVQILSDVVLRGPDGRERRGRGVFEQLILGSHAPSGFASLLDFAP